MSVWDRRKKILKGSGLVVEVSQNNPLLSVRSMAQTTMTVECK